MSTAALMTIIGIVSGAVGVISALAATRYTWRRDRRENAAAKIETAKAKSADDREREAAADRATDRLVEALKDANTVAIENERLKYENKLYEEITKLKKQHRQQMDEMRMSLIAEMKREVALAVEAALDLYGCDSAPHCPDRIARKRTDPSI